jgi:hypothetical protein
MSVCFKVTGLDLWNGSKLLTDGTLDDAHSLHATVQVKPEGCTGEQSLVVELWAAVKGKTPSAATSVMLATRAGVSLSQPINPAVPESGGFLVAKHASILNPTKSWTYPIDLIARTYVKGTIPAVYPSAADGLSTQRVVSFNCRTAAATAAMTPIDRIPQPTVSMEQAVRAAKRTLQNIKK